MRRMMIDGLRCSTCNLDHSAITDHESGEIVCANCGVIILERNQDSSQPERRIYGIEEYNKRVRTGPRVSLAVHDMGLSTIIGKSNKDASGHILNAVMRSTMERLRLWDSRIYNNSLEGKSLKEAFHCLNTIKDKLGLSDSLVEKSAYIYRKAQERGLVRGRTIDGILTAAVYIACRETDTPRTLQDIMAVSNLKRKEITRDYRRLVLDLDIRIPIVDPMKCIIKITNRLRLSEKTKHEAMNIMTKVIKMEINAGKIPMGLAGATVYISSIKTGENTPQNSIAAASGVTEVTIRNRCNDLKNKMGTMLQV
jgi:transcription initiation factor TFIIB